MSTVTIPYRYKVRGGTAAALAALNEIPLSREMIEETDTGLRKLGDGVTAYNSLPYRNGIQTIAAGTNITVDDTDPLNPVVSASGGGDIRDTWLMG